MPMFNGKTVQKRSFEDLTCSICQSLFVEPVSLPCGHDFCRLCFEGVLKHNALTCPCCRQRFGNWLRRATRTNCLVNQKLWKYIKENCQQSVEKENFKPAGTAEIVFRATGKVNNKQQQDTSATTKSAAMATTRQRTVAPASFAAPTTTMALTAGRHSPLITLSEPGEIRREYEKELDLFRRELEIEKQNELKASEELIVKLLLEELQANSSDSSISEQIEGPIDMLVANPGHTPYTLTGSTIAKKSNNCCTLESKRNNVAAAAVASSSSNSHIATAGKTNNSSHTFMPSLNIPSQPSNLVTANLTLPPPINFLKNIAVRVNRDAELAKPIPSKSNAVVPSKPLSSSKSSSSTTLRNARPVLTVPPTKIHRAPSRNANSADSLRLEMCHFKPIRTVPTTPTRRSGTPTSITLDTIRTPKPRKLLSYNRNDSDNDPVEIQSSSLQQALIKSPRKSAFCLVTKLNDLASKQGVESSQDRKDRRNRSNQKIPVVRLRRYRINETVAISTPRHRRCLWSQIKSKLNSDLGATLIAKQKYCEELLRQEREDFELAKKMQAELNRAPAARVERTIPCTRRRRKLEAEMNGCGGTMATAAASIATTSRQRDDAVSIEPDEIIDLTESSSPAKRCRRQCGRILAKNDNKSVSTSDTKTNNRMVNGKTSSQTVDSDKQMNLRRSKRRIKPPRK